MSRCASSTQCFFTLYQTSAAHSTLSPAFAGGGGASRPVGVDPRPDRRILGQVRRDRQRHVVVRRRQRHVAHLHVAAVLELARRVGARERPCPQVDVDPVAGELLDRIGNRAQPADQRPLVREQEGGPPCPDRRRVGNPQPDHRHGPAGHRVDDGRALFRKVRQRVPHRHLGRVAAVQHVQDLDRLHAALAVPDQHRRHAVALVVPRDDARQPLRVLVRAMRPLPVAGVADLRLRIAHAHEEAAERHHRQVHGVDAAVHQHDPRRRPLGQRVAHVGGRHVLRVEREDALLDRPVRHGRRGQHGNVLGSAQRPHDAAGDRNRRREHRDTCEFPIRVHRRFRAQATTAATILATSSDRNAEVRYDTPTCRRSPTDAGAITIGANGPVDTARR